MFHLCGWDKQSHRVEKKFESAEQALEYAREFCTIYRVIHRNTVIFRYHD